MFETVIYYTIQMCFQDILLNVLFNLIRKLIFL